MRNFMAIFDDEPDLAQTLAKRLELRGYGAKYFCTEASIAIFLQEHQRLTHCKFALIDYSWKSTANNSTIWQFLLEQWPGHPPQWAIMTGHGPGSLPEESAFQQKNIQIFYKPLPLDTLLTQLENIGLHKT